MLFSHNTSLLLSNQNSVLTPFQQAVGRTKGVRCSRSKTQACSFPKFLETKNQRNKKRCSIAAGLTVYSECPSVHVVRAASVAEDLSADSAVVAAPEHREGAVAPVADPAHPVLQRVDTRSDAFTTFLFRPRTVTPWTTCCASSDENSSREL